MNRIRLINRILIVVVGLTLAAIAVLCSRSAPNKSADGTLSEVPPESDCLRMKMLGDVSGEHYILVSSSGVEFVGIESVFFYDITGDGVPEIWMVTEDCEADRKVLVYSLSDWGRELYRGSAGHSLFYAGNGYVLRLEAHMGYASWYRLSWDGRKMVTKKVFEETTGGDYTEPSEKPLDEFFPGDLSPDCLWA